MKKLTLISLVASLLFFFTPVFVNAQGGTGVVGSTCTNGNQCASGYCHPENDYCTANPSGPGTSVTGGGQGAVNTTYLLGYKNSIVGIINGIIVPVLIAIAFLVFIWGIFKAFIMNAASESEKMEGRKFAMWGIIGFVIIFSVWGIVRIVGLTLNLDQAGSLVPKYPTL